MALINFKEIDFNKSINTTTKVINFNDSKIEIVPYLSARDKYDLIMATLNKSFEQNIYNSFKMDLMFDLNVIYSYTNILFDDEDRFDEAELHDILSKSGLIAAVMKEIPAEELSYLRSCILSLSETIIKYRNTFGAVFGSFLESFPNNAEKVKTIMESIDLEKMQGLLALVHEITPNP